MRQNKLEKLVKNIKIFYLKITNFLFCEKILKKVLTNKKRYSIMQIVPHDKEQKSTLKSKQ